MKPGETKTIQVPAERAYGPHFEERVIDVDRQELPQDVKPEVNQMFQIHQADGHVFVVTVTAISESKVTLDGNHPLAGKDLTFDIQLTEIA